MITFLRTFRNIIHCLFAFIALFIASPAGAKQKPKPNIVLILVDDLGWTDLGCFGSKYYETPAIDGLCKAGMKFTNGYAACTVCSPTRASLMTGRYPAGLHVTDWIPGRTPPGAEMQIPDWRKFLDTSELTLAEVLRTAGYATASIGKWHLGPKNFWPQDQGFDINYAGSDRGNHSSMFSPFKDMDVPGAKEGDYLTDLLTTRAEEFIEANKERPFFLYLPQYAVHTPIQAKEELIKKFKAKQPSGGHSKPAYAAMIAGVDESVGRILKKLESTGLDKNTIVIFYSDNGGLEKQTSNAPLRAGKATAYEGGLRVPLIIRWPEVISPGSVCEVPVTSPDFFPTILEAIGGNPRQHFIDGESIMPLLTGKGTLQRKSVYWHYPHYNAHGPEHPTKPFGAVRRGDYKLIEFYADRRVALYDLKKDVSETTDLAEKMPDLAADMLLDLHTWRQSVNAQMPTFSWENYNPEAFNEWLRYWHSGNRSKNWDDVNRQWVDKEKKQEK